MWRTKKTSMRPFQRLVLFPTYTKVTDGAKKSKQKLNERTEKQKKRGKNRRNCVCVWWFRNIFVYNNNNDEKNTNIYSPSTQHTAVECDVNAPTGNRIKSTNEWNACGLWQKVYFGCILLLSLGEQRKRESKTERDGETEIETHQTQTVHQQQQTTIVYVIVTLSGHNITEHRYEYVDRDKRFVANHHYRQGHSPPSTY